MKRGKEAAMSARSKPVLDLLLCALGLLTGAHAQAQPPAPMESIDLLLDRADAARSVDPPLAKRIIDQLNADPRPRDIAQGERLQYLNAYTKVLAGRYQDALVEAKSLLATATDPDTRARTGALIVNIYAITRDFTAGLRQLESTISQIDTVRNPDYREQIYGVAATMQNKIGQHRLAKDYAERVLGMTTSARARCFAGQTRLDALQRMGELKDDATAQQVIEGCEAARETIVVNLARVNLARKWVEDGDVARAISTLHDHLSDVKATRYPELIAEFEALIAECELLLGKPLEAEKHALAAVAEASALKFSQPLVSAYRTLYTVSEARGDSAQALVQYRNYAEADKAYLSEVKTRELAYQIVRQESLQKSQQIELLDRKNQVLELERKVNDQKSQSSRLLVLWMVLLMGSVIFWGIRTKRMQTSLRRMAESDALTAISNRHHFSAQSEATLVQSARDGEDVALLMFDLDHFKSINDRFGHDTGDWVLQRVADTCKGFCRRIDYLGRLGGEEFAILLAGCDLRGANRVAEDCRVRIASIDTTPSGHKFVVTASFGATATSLSGYDLAKLLSHADMMLYRAKRAGRNRVCMYDGNVPAAPSLQPQPAERDAVVYELPARTADVRQSPVT